MLDLASRRCAPLDVSELLLDKGSAHSYTLGDCAACADGEGKLVAPRPGRAPAGRLFAETLPLLEAGGAPQSRSYRAAMTARWYRSASASRSAA